MPLSIYRKRDRPFLRLRYKKGGKVQDKHIGKLEPSPCPILDTILANTAQLNLEQLERLITMSKHWRDITWTTF